MRYGLGLLLVIYLSLPPAYAADADPQKVMIRACAGCHTPGAAGGLSRIDAMRKTPEGWEMSIIRMGIWHDVRIDPQDLRVLVKHLADTQGLAPEETAAHRGLLERRPNMQESAADPDLLVMCARCHSYGRIALQRRDEAEWRKLAHTHLGQFPSTEYQNFGRDRNWWEIARDQMPPKLAALYPLQTGAWTQWKARPANDPSGRWRVSGERPGVGRYTGYLTVKALGGDQYEAQYDLVYANGNKANGTGKAIVYTGYEWRGEGKLGNDTVRSVYALAADGDHLNGRWFLKDADEIGADLSATRIKDGAAGIVAVEPPFLRAGAKTTVHLYGHGLSGKVDLGPGLAVKRVVSEAPDHVAVDVQADGQASVGKRAVTVGKTSAADALIVYQAIDAIRVEPAFAIARVGGGPIDPVKAQLQAIAYLNGSDGKAGTEDDIRLGSVPATWSTDNFDPTAAALKDAQFAGKLDAVSGLFSPAGAGPNPARTLNGNNTGNLKVKAAFKEGTRSLTGEGQLIVTVQRWNTPPLR